MSSVRRGDTEELLVMKTKNEKARLEGEIQEWKGRRKEEYV